MLNEQMDVSCSLRVAASAVIFGKNQHMSSCLLKWPAGPTQLEALRSSEFKDAWGEAYLLNHAGGEPR